MLWSQTWREKLWGVESLTAPFYSRQSLYSSREFPGALVPSLKKIIMPTLQCCLDITWDNVCHWLGEMTVYSEYRMNKY